MVLSMMQMLGTVGTSAPPVEVPLHCLGGQVFAPLYTPNLLNERWIPFLSD